MVNLNKAKVMKIMDRLNNGDFKVYIQGNRPKNSERTEVPENISPPSLA